LNPFDHNSDAQAINTPTVSTKKWERSTQTRCTYTGGLPRPAKFDPDDPALVYRFPEYSPDKDIGLPFNSSFPVTLKITVNFLIDCFLMRKAI
jgi:hypothetical protein